jgi:hypothetical protein
LAVGLVVWFVRSTRAQEPEPLRTPEAARAIQQDEGTPAKSEETPAKKEAKAGGAGPKFDPAVVSAGQAAFERGCTKCHDAARSLERTKDLVGWRATVRRMAARRGADIPQADIEPISVYLASRSAGGTSGTEAESGKTAESGTGAEKEKIGAAAGSDSPSLSAFASLSPQWRGGNDRLQNPGFGPIAWVGGAWETKILSARVTVCVACHGVQEQAFLSRVDIAEAAVRVNLSEYLDKCWHGLKGGIDAGRFIVPFGAFSSQTNPSLYRTVSTPLIFNMGQRIFNQDIGDTVLPMPYSDTGVNLNFDVPVCEIGTDRITGTMDTYLVNGLWGNSNGIDFLSSRNFWDNNNRAAGGARLTLGDPYIRAGASVTAGRLDDPKDPGVPSGPLNYRIYGVDLQARYKRLFRCQIEYARRDTDRIGQLVNGQTEFLEKVDGYYLEVEVRPCEDSKVSFLARHDILNRASPLPPPTSTLPAGSFHVERLTLGINIELWHQSLLMINFERWFLPEPGERAVNVYGVRYSISF